MGRDTTASKRMAAMRSREKAAGLRRLNVAIMPVVFDKLAELMKQHNCTSQAKLIELLVMDSSTVLTLSKVKTGRNEVTAKSAKLKPKTASKKQKKTQKKTSPAKATKGTAKVVTVMKELPSAQLSLFDN
jgi:hypothetical protein